MAKTKENFTRYDTADYLETEEDIAAYLTACADEDDPALARRRGGGDSLRPAVGTDDDVDLAAVDRGGQGGLLHLREPHLPVGRLQPVGERARRGDVDLRRRGERASHRQGAAARLRGASGGRLDAVTGDGAWLCRTPFLPLDPPRNGTGDAIAALFYGQFLKTASVPRALSLAMSSLYAVLNVTHQLGTREIQLIAAQDELVQPRQVFEAEKIG